MKYQFIDKETGNLMFPNGFSVSPKTKPQEITTHFGIDNLTVRDMRTGWKHYSLRNIHLIDTYLNITFYFENDFMKSASFIVGDHQLPAHLSWDSYSYERELELEKFYDNWLIQQVGAMREFTWGEVGPCMDPKGGVASIVLNYFYS